MHRSAAFHAVSPERTELGGGGAPELCLSTGFSCSLVPAGAQCQVRALWSFPLFWAFPSFNQQAVSSREAQGPRTRPPPQEPCLLGGGSDHC